MSVAVDPSTIEHLDWTFTLPCEHSTHDVNHADEPAKYLIDVDPCPTSRGKCRPLRYLICKSGWDHLHTGLIYCGACNDSVDPHEVMHIVKEIQ